jgi:hypothetical protein
MLLVDVGTMMDSAEDEMTEVLEVEIVEEDGITFVVAPLLIDTSVVTVIDPIEIVMIVVAAVIGTRGM